MDLWLEFLGIYLSEGSCDNENTAQSHGYRVFITQIKEESKAKIEEMLSKMPLILDMKAIPLSFIITTLGVCKTIWRLLSNLFLVIFCISSRQLSILFDWLMLGDGHIRPLKSGG